MENKYIEVEIVIDKIIKQHPYSHVIKFNKYNERLRLRHAKCKNERKRIRESEEDILYFYKLLYEGSHFKQFMHYWETLEELEKYEVSRRGLWLAHKEKNPIRKRIY